MSSKKQRRLQELAELEQKLSASRKRRRWIVVGALLAITTIATFAFWPLAKKSAEKPEDSGKQQPPKKTDNSDKWTLDALLSLKPHQLEDMDIALMNLLCAEGLHGSEDINIQKSVALLDEMATRVRFETNRHRYRFVRNPAEYENSEAYFRIMMLIVVLQGDFGIRYNPARIMPAGVMEPSMKFYADSKDVFIHGCTGERRMGTCSSLPVLYTAVSRRLGYPVSLVSAKAHLFARWQDEHTHINIEATSVGFLSKDDEYYKTWPRPMSDDEQREDGYLINLTPVQEFAVFLRNRGMALLYTGKPDAAIDVFEKIVRLLPDEKVHQKVLYFAQQQVANLRQSQQRAAGNYGVKMPPDFALRNEPPDVAWIMWKQQQALRRLPPPTNGIPAPTPGVQRPMFGQPFPVQNPGLPAHPGMR